MVLLSPCFWLSDKPGTWKVPSPSVWIEMGCMCGNQPLDHWKGSNREDEGHKKVNQETGGLIRLRIQRTLTSLWTSAVLESHQQRPPDALCVERRATASVKRKVATATAGTCARPYRSTLFPSGEAEHIARFCKDCFAAPHACLLAPTSHATQSMSARHRSPRRTRSCSRAAAYMVLFHAATARCMWLNYSN